jgi:drug/metabolite transporter (DMT)-like permease
MGVFSTVILGVLLIEKDLPPFKDYWLELLMVNGFYLIGQFSFFLAITKTEASRLAPLLGLKVILIAMLGILFLNIHLNAWQWVAVVLCFVGAVLSNWSGKTIPMKGVLWLLTAVVGYALSDMSIKLLIDRIAVTAGKGVLAMFIAATASYFYLGLFSIVVILFIPQVKVKHLKPAVPFSCLWFSAMLLLFACFGFIGPLFGNIVQSGRGIMAVLLGALIAKFGWSEHEEKLPRSILVRRIAAAMMITGAIILFAVAKTSS